MKHEGQRQAADSAPDDDDFHAVPQLPSYYFKLEIIEPDFVNRDRPNRLAIGFLARVEGNEADFCAYVPPRRSSFGGKPCQLACSREIGYLWGVRSGN
jgi:hypothetical protein